MDQSEDWKLQGGEKFQKYQFLKRSILQFVFSVSALSFLLWYSFGFSILPHDESYSFKAFFSTFLFSLFSHTLERKYMFLLCNAILAFVAKTSLTSSPSSISASDIDDESVQASNLSETKAGLPVSEEAPSLAAEDQETEQEKKQEHCEEQVSAAGDQEQEDGEAIEAPIAKEEVGTGGSGVIVVTKDDDEADAAALAENEELSNADELNRKVEEFIRKMKEEIRIEAQRQLIAV